MDDNSRGFVEKIGNVTYVVNLKSAEDAKQTKAEYIERLIASKAVLFEVDVA